MEYEKVDEMTLALLYLTTFNDRYGLRAWKGFAWDILDRLHEKGYIDNPKSKAKSVNLCNASMTGGEGCHSGGIFFESSTVLATKKMLPA